MSETVTPSTYRVRAHSTLGGRAEVAAGTETVAFDASWAVGPSGLPGPGELLAAAFAACLLKNVERASKLLPVRYQSADVEVTARRQDAPPRFVDISYELHLVTDEPERRVELLHHNLRRYGTVFNTLAAACEIHGRVAVTRPADA
jgi:uncharacterized OsmC-like protein